MTSGEGNGSSVADSGGSPPAAAKSDGPRGLEARETGFRICEQKGFHVTFENGWTVSVQFGRGNYCGNYDHPDYRTPVPASRTAEVAAIGPDGSFRDLGDDTVRGWQTPAQVLALMVEIAALSSEAPGVSPSAASASASTPDEQHDL